jgi:hypothetical protein
MKRFPEFLQENKIASIFTDKTVQKTWLKNLAKIYNGANTWDYQWAFANLDNNSYSIIPNVNLISNIGFGIESTHTFDEDDVLANMPLGSITEIIHPEAFFYEVDADYFTNTKVFNSPSLLKRVKLKMKKILG